MARNENIPYSNDADVIVSEAASWVALIDSGKITDADRIALSEWVARSPRHLFELKELGGMWCEIDDVISTCLEQDELTRASLGGVIAAGTAINPVGVYRSVAACVGMVAVLISAVFVLANSNDRYAYGIALSVGEGENQRFDLKDGSNIHLNTNSLVEIDFDKGARDVRLVRGEAHFVVAKDPDRPFSVYAGESLVQAIGTAFSVRLNENDTSVIVTEGIVQLSARPNLSVASDQHTATFSEVRNARLSAGQRALVVQDEKNPALVVEPISSETVSKNLAWRNGLIIFDGEPLSYVVDEISRYTPSRVVISDPEIRDLPIGGVFEAGEVDALLGALKTSFGVEITEIEDGLIYLSKPSDG